MDTQPTDIPLPAHMNQEQATIWHHVRKQLEGQKMEVRVYYAELKLKLPTYLKTVTLGELKLAGAEIEPNIQVPKKLENYLRTHADALRKKTDLTEKIGQTHEQHKKQITAYYEGVKKKLPQNTLYKTMAELDDAEWNLLGIDILRFRVGSPQPITNPDRPRKKVRG